MKRYIKLKRFVKKKTKRKKRKSNKKNILNQSKLSKWSKSVRERDFFKCFSCGKGKTLHGHHMVSKYYFPQYAYHVNNGITLCKRCHLGKGGVHCKKSPPKNSVIKKLRYIYYTHNINESKKIGNLQKKIFKEFYSQ